jgi:dihydrodipicolinate synthase/N-acetylneuraminate lyase
LHDCGWCPCLASAHLIIHFLIDSGIDFLVALGTTSWIWWRL